MQLATLFAFAVVALAGSIKDIKHVVLFMQENRAFDHVRCTIALDSVLSLTISSTLVQWLAFVDSLILMYNSTPARTSQLFNSKCYPLESRRYTNKIHRKINTCLSPLATSLLPFYINYLGGNWTAASQCASGGSNSWFNNHLALNGDLNDQWAWDNTAMSWSHFQRQDLPLHFALAESWTLADMYQEGVIASTSPNRVTWMSGSINCPGGPQTPDQGGIVTDNSEGPGE